MKIVKKVYVKIKKIIKRTYHKFIFSHYKSKFGKIGIGTKILGKIWFTEPSNIFIGENVLIGPLCRIETFSNYGGKNSNPKMIIGNNVSIQHAVHLYCCEYLEIQDGSLIASGCMITDNNHGTNPIGDFYGFQPLKSHSTIIKKGVWLGENVAVLAGSVIGERSIIGANSVVKGNIPDYCIAVGNPAVVIKKFNFGSNKWEKVN